MTGLSLKNWPYENTRTGTLFFKISKHYAEIVSSLLALSRTYFPRIHFSLWYFFLNFVLL